ncbi:MAG TPA: hypothetical protein VKQ09_06180 [Sphingomonas sp.]|nr:hypothetical protein [Sphingomonas sp.]
MRDVSPDWFGWYMKLVCTLAGTAAAVYLMLWGFNLHSTPVLLVDFVGIVFGLPLLVVAIRHLIAEFRLLKD